MQAATNWRVATVVGRRESAAGLPAFLFVFMGVVEVKDVIIVPCVIERLLAVDSSSETRVSSSIARAWSIGHDSRRTHSHDGAPSCSDLPSSS